MLAGIRTLLIVLLLAFCGVAHAVQPDEILSDPALEARARTLSAELRCMVCQNQSIDDSNAELARDLRVLVRERLVAGDNDEEVIDFVVARYGEFVLLKPRISGRNILLWIAPALLLLLGAALIWKLRRPVTAAKALTGEESERLKQILEQRKEAG